MRLTSTMLMGVAETSPFSEIAGVQACDEAFASVHEFAPQRRASIADDQRQKSLNRYGDSSV